MFYRRVVVVIGTIHLDSIFAGIVQLRKTLKVAETYMILENTFVKNVHLIIGLIKCIIGFLTFAPLREMTRLTSAIAGRPETDPQWSVFFIPPSHHP